MEHGHLVEKYNKAQDLFKKKKYRRAKKLFREITSEIYTSDTDSMADMNLCDASQNYLDEINEMHPGKSLMFWIFMIVLCGFTVAYLFLKLLGK